jgi:hypothetical protein
MNIAIIVMFKRSNLVTINKFLIDRSLKSFVISVLIFCKHVNLFPFFKGGKHANILDNKS